MKYVPIVLLFSIFILSCTDSNKNENLNTFKKNREDNSSFGSYPDNTMEREFSGISTNSNIVISNGIVQINLRNGILNTNSGDSILFVTNNQINGKLSLKNYVTGSSVPGVTVASQEKVTFTPYKPLLPQNVYKLVFSENPIEKEHQENIFISVANSCNPNSVFSEVPVISAKVGSKESVNLALKETLHRDPVFDTVAIVAWDHLAGNSFYFKISNRTQGAKYRIISSYAVYDIPGKECELYIQRDSNSPFPTWHDSNYGSKETKVTREDNLIYNPMNGKYYSFTKSYLLIKVFNQSNVDITSTDTAILSLEQTDSLYGLPVTYSAEEESSLLAYLNRGNNNSYSMVLGGLILGIFGFFLSRRLLKREEEL